MKKVLMVLLISMFLVGAVDGAPFLISDPHPECGENEGQNSCPVACEIFVDGVSIVDNYSLEADMSIKYDLENMPSGNHKYEAKFIDKWGRKSALSPVPFFLLSEPQVPGGMKLIP